MPLNGPPHMGGQQGSQARGAMMVSVRGPFIQNSTLPYFSPRTIPLVRTFVWEGDRDAQSRPMFGASYFLITIMLIIRLL